MADRPILFSGPLVRALLSGIKTETRRLVTKSTSTSYGLDRAARPWPATISGPNGLQRTGDKTLWSGLTRTYVAPRIQSGDTLWVRETFYCDHAGYPDAPIDEMLPMIEYRASHDCASWEAGCPCADEDGHGSWRPSIFMPRWASRIILRVTEVRAERVQEITHTGALAEGLEPDEPGFNARVPFARLWDEINGKRPGAAWSDNPWVWVIKFEVIS